MKRSTSYLVFWEAVLLIGSIPLFRSVWIMLDSVDFLKRGAGVAGSCAIGVLLCLASLVALNRKDNG